MTTRKLAMSWSCKCSLIAGKPTAEIRPTARMMFQGVVKLFPRLY